MKSFNILNQQINDNSYSGNTNKSLQLNNNSCYQCIKNGIVSVFLKRFFI
ncbi:MAG: hypothetical protein K0S61_906 [Anaerocolumna sp.]|jgi:hypothetical protein|nr:hypothetical protein [Anaerocolumna sp.]